MKQYKILIIEDDININELIEITLKSPDLVIKSVHDGTTAIAMLKEDIPDLVVLDIMIPAPDGWEIYNTIRSNPDFTHTKVLILTALYFSNEFLALKNISPTDLVMKKPFEIDELKSNADNMLKKEPER